MPKSAAKVKVKNRAGSQERTRAPRLLVQPEDGVAPLIESIDGAQQSIDILIFRFDHRAVEQALLAAVRRGVRVRALIAHTNRGGEKNLRALEMRLLGAGITVARSADDLARYHAKLMIIDEQKLFVLAFNFTYLDIEHSRSFGVILDDRKPLREAMELFEADMLRKPFVQGQANLLISPINAREGLAAFLEGAKKELLIYDPNVSDAQMLRILTAKSKAGVDVKIVGRAAKLPARRLPHIRLHARVIVRDRVDVSIGSQSLRTLELDGRREVGVIFHDLTSALRIAKTFAADWDLAAEPLAENVNIDGPLRTGKIAKKVAKAVTKELPPVAEVLDLVIKEVAGDDAEMPLNPEQLQETVADAVKQAVKEVVRNAVHEAAAQGAIEPSR